LRKRLLDLMDIPVFLDSDATVLARAAGVGPWKKILVSPAWEALPNAEKSAVLVHEVGHCKAFHMEKRIAMLILTALPVLAVLPWPFIVAALTSIAVWEFTCYQARTHELEADRFAAQAGYAGGLVTYLMRAPEVSDAEDFYPTNAERIAALTCQQEAPCSSD
jgi:Zn-dependent protease with chaperone function